MVWDTAGQEEFDSITRTYYRGNACCNNARMPISLHFLNTPPPFKFAGAGAAVLVFSTTDQASFHAVKRWKNKVQKHRCRYALLNLDVSDLKCLFRLHADRG